MPIRVTELLYAFMHLVTMSIVMVYLGCVVCFTAWVSTSDLPALAAQMADPAAAAHLNGGAAYLRALLSPHERAAALMAAPTPHSPRTAKSVSPLAAVVVGSAALNASMTGVSRMYRERVATGLRVALLTGAPWVVFTGSAFDCDVVRRLVLSGDLAVADVLPDPPEATRRHAGDGGADATAHYRAVRAAVRAHGREVGEQWLVTGSPLQYFRFPRSGLAHGSATYNTSVNELVANVVRASSARLEVTRPAGHDAALHIPRLAAPVTARGSDGPRAVVLPGLVFVAADGPGRAAEARAAARTVMALLTAAATVRQRETYGDAEATKAGQGWWWLGAPVRVLTVAGEGGEQCARLALAAAAAVERDRFLRAVRAELRPAASSFLRHAYAPLHDDVAESDGVAADHERSVAAPHSPTGFRVAAEVVTWSLPLDAQEPSHDLPRWLPFDSLLPVDSPRNRLLLTRKLGTVSHYIYLNYLQLKNRFVISSRLPEDMCSGLDLIGHIAAGEVRIRDIFSR